MSETTGLVIGLMFIAIGLVLFNDVIPTLAVILGGILVIAGSALRLGADT